MTTTAAPTAPTSAGRVRSGATSPGTARTPEEGVAGGAGVPTAGAATRAERREPGPSGFHAAVVLAVLLTVPAVFLVARGELSPHDAMVRFGCAWAFATGGVALVLSTVGGGSVSQDGEPADLAP